MKIYPILAFLIAILAQPSVSQETKGTGPRMDYPKAGWNFGTVIQGVQKRKKLKLKNTGSKTLIINFAKVTCGCLKASPQSQKIEPNKTGILTVDLDSFRQRGKVRKHIVVSTNSPTERQVFIPVTGEIKPIYRLEHQNLDLGVIPANEGAAKEMKVYCLPGRWPKIKSVAFENGHLKIATKRFGKIDGEHGLVITAKLAPLAKAQKVIIPVRLNLAEDTLDAIRFVVLAKIQGDLIAEPERIKCTSLKKDKEYKTKLTLRSLSRRPFCITKATCHDPRIVLGKIESASKARHTLLVTAAPGGKLGVIRSRIYLVTDQEDQRVITVPIEIRVTP